MSKTDNSFSLKDNFYGAATVGERGQLVIPVDARKKYGIETGDKMLIMGAPHGRGLMLVKIDALRDFMTAFQSDLQSLEREIDETPPDGKRQNGKTEDTAS